jgi:hypothetical protein
MGGHRGQKIACHQDQRIMHPGSTAYEVTQHQDSNLNPIEFRTSKRSLLIGGGNNVEQW